MFHTNIWKTNDFVISPGTWCSNKLLWARVKLYVMCMSCNCIILNSFSTFTGSSLLITLKEEMDERNNQRCFSYWEKKTGEAIRNAFVRLKLLTQVGELSILGNCFELNGYMGLLHIRNRCLKQKHIGKRKFPLQTMYEKVGNRSNLDKLENIFK